LFDSGTCGSGDEDFLKIKPFFVVFLFGKYSDFGMM
jgi:hypothetical protein